MSQIQNSTSIEYTIKYSNKLGLSEFTNSLNAIAGRYNAYLESEYEDARPHNAQLYIEKIEEGSVVTTLVECVDATLPFLADINTVGEFGAYLKSAFDFFKTGKKQDQTREYGLAELKEFGQIIRPGEDVDRSIKIEIKGNQNNVIILDANSEESNTMSNRIKNLIDENKNVKDVYYEQVLFYFDQAKTDIKSKKGNYGVIESISLERLRVLWNNKDDKKKMLHSKFNPLNSFFVVDVEVQHAHGRARAYKIVRLHEHFES